MIYRVDFADGTCCHTGYRPLALVWAKRKDSKMTEIEEMQKHVLMVTAGGDMEARPLYATSPEGMELDAIKSSVAPGCHVLLPAAALAVAIYWRGE